MDKDFVLELAMFYDTQTCLADFECPVCSREATEDEPLVAVSLRCGHLVCPECIHHMLERAQERCPLCRDPAGLDRVSAALFEENSPPGD